MGSITSWTGKQLYQARLPLCSACLIPNKNNLCLSLVGKTSYPRSLLGPPFNDYLTPVRRWGIESIPSENSKILPSLCEEKLEERTSMILLSISALLVLKTVCVTFNECNSIWVSWWLVFCLEVQDTILYVLYLWSVLIGCHVVSYGLSFAVAIIFLIVTCILRMMNDTLLSNYFCWNSA